MHPRNGHVGACALLVVLTACSTATSPGTPVAPTSPPVTATTVESSPTEQPVATVEAVTKVPLSGCTGTESTSWSQSAIGCKGSNYEHTTYKCRPGGQAYTVWGTDIYTNDSSVCTAAVHAGLIGFENGGEVVIELRPGEPSYLGTTANGVTTMSYGHWGRAFVFIDG